MAKTTMTRAEYALFLMTDGENDHDIEYTTGWAPGSREHDLILAEKKRVGELYLQANRPSVLDVDLDANQVQNTKNIVAEYLANCAQPPNRYVQAAIGRLLK